LTSKSEIFICGDFGIPIDCLKRESKSSGPALPRGAASHLGGFK